MSSDSDTLEEDVKAIGKELDTVKKDLEILNWRFSKESSHNRKCNLLFFQIAKEIDSGADGPSKLRTHIINLINGQIMQTENWTVSKILNIIRLKSGKGRGPVLVRFADTDFVNTVMANCKNLAGFNSARKRKGQNPVSVKRHFDERSSGRIQYLQSLAMAIRKMPKFKETSVKVLEKVNPVLVVGDTRYHMHQLPDEIACLVPAYSDHPTMYD